MQATHNYNTVARDAFMQATAKPVNKKVVEAAYFINGKSSDNLLGFGLEPVQSGIPASAPPNPPSNLVAIETSLTSVNLDWDPVPGVLRYHVYIGIDSNAMQVYGSAGSSELDIAGLMEGTKYYFYVTALNSVGESQPSNFTTRRTL